MKAVMRIVEGVRELERSEEEAVGAVWKAEGVGERGGEVGVVRVREEKDLRFESEVGRRIGLVLERRRVWVRGAVGLRVVGCWVLVVKEGRRSELRSLVEGLLWLWLSRRFPWDCLVWL